MTTTWKKATVTCKAKVAGPSLVAVFESEGAPVVWQLDLEKNTNFVFSIGQDTEGWALGITRTSQPFEPVVHFDDLVSAEQALAAIHSALRGRNVKGKYRGCLYALGGMLFATLVFLGALYVYGNYVMKSAQEAAVAEALGEKAKLPIGVPVAADDYLTAPAPGVVPEAEVPAAVPAEAPQ